MGKEIVNKNKGGRPDTYNYELCIEICEQVANGENIKRVLASSPNYPTFQTWCNWKRKNKELFDLYVNSMQDKAESEIENIDIAIQDLRQGDIDPSTANVIIQTSKWKASKFYPKMFGDKVDVTTDGEKVNTNPIQVTLGVIDAEKKKK